MLVLSRKENQAIYIGDNIKVTVLRVQGKTIRVGIEAPENVRILRGELTEWHDLSVNRAEPMLRETSHCLLNVAAH